MFIKGISQARFDRAGINFLWLELTIFSVIYGLMIKSWLVFAVLFLGPAWLMSRPQTVVYTVFVMSFLWAWIFAVIGYGFGGWIGAVVLGGLVFSNGVRLHFRDLKRSWVDADIAVAINAAQWRQNWQGGQQNLN